MKKVLMISEQFTNADKQKHRFYDSANEVGHSILHVVKYIAKDGKLQVVKRYKEDEIVLGEV